MCHYITFATVPTISKSNWKPQIKFSVIYLSIRDQICFGSHCTIVLMDRKGKRVGLIWFFYFVGHVLISSISWVKKTMWETIFDRLRHYWRDDVHIFKYEALRKRILFIRPLRRNILSINFLEFMAISCTDTHTMLNKLRLWYTLNGGKSELKNAPMIR